MNKLISFTFHVHYLEDLYIDQEFLQRFKAYIKKLGFQIIF